MNFFVVTSLFLQVLFSAAGDITFLFYKLVINTGELKHKEIIMLYMIFFFISVQENKGNTKQDNILIILTFRDSLLKHPQITIILF